ncbi:hypothetical protein BY996DRAFT_6409966 [Phakopsora pachyrhizi]|nr:hypothetical protein BY996DRAFT_6409966 [Phakopsora pachyrhizi]
MLQTIDPGTIRQILMRLEDTVILSQILAIQSLRYLILSLLTPPMLQLFSSPFPLELEGGPSNLAMIMDWREIIGIGTINQSLNFNKQQQQQASLRPWANGNYIHSKLLPPRLDRKLSRINVRD